MRSLLFSICLFVFYNADAQSADTAHLYNPNANAEKDIAMTVQKAMTAHKFVLIQAGGN